MVQRIFRSHAPQRHRRIQATGDRLAVVWALHWALSLSPQREAICTAPKDHATEHSQ